MTDDPTQAQIEMRRSAAVLLSEVIDADWPDVGPPEELLRALCVLERDDPDPKGHDPYALAVQLASTDGVLKDMVEKLGDDPKSVGSAGGDARKRINNAWRKFEKKGVWERRSGPGSKVEERFRASGLGVLPVPTKLPGGGRDKTNLYRLDVVPLTTTTVQSEPESVTAAVEPATQTLPLPDVLAPRDPVVTYGFASTELPRWLDWIPAHGGRTRSPFGLVFVGLLLSLWLVGIAVLVFGFSMAYAAERTVDALQALLSTGAFLFAGWLVFQRWFHLAEDNVAIAPGLLNRGAGTGNNVLEIRRDPAGKASPRLHLVRYVADCPLCGGELGRSAVRIESGRLEFAVRRIVGRCRHAPNAHVFSFDHIRREGRLLR